MILLLGAQMKNKVYYNKTKKIFTKKGFEVGITLTTIIQIKIINTQTIRSIQTPAAK